MDAPCSIGRVKYGVEKVLSTIRGYAIVSCDFSDRFEVGNIEAWIAYGLTKKSLGFFRYGSSIVLWIVGIDKLNIDTKLWKNIINWV